MAFRDYNVDPDENLQLEGPIYIGPNMARNDVRPALQRLAADGRAAYDDMLGSIADPSAVLFMPAGAGAVERTYQSKVREWVSPADFGAVGNGIADDSAAIQAALNISSHVQMPPGIFSASNLKLSSGHTIRGMGPGVTTIKALPNQLPHVPIIRNLTDNPATAGARDTDISIIGLTLDGNKANNATQIEYGACIELFAVNGFIVDEVIARNAQGDGLLLMYAYDAEGVGGYHVEVGCSNGFVRLRSENCARQGVAIICAENIEGSIITFQSELFGLDLEPDQEPSFIRNITLRHLSYQDGNGTASAGGIGIGHAGAGSCENINLDFAIFEPDGKGVMWRQAKGLTLRGTIIRPTIGLFGFPSGATGSNVQFDVHVEDPGTFGLTCQEATASTYNGRVSVNSAGDISAAFSGAGAVSGTLDLHLANGAAQGLVLTNVDATKMTIANLTTLGMTSHCLWLLGTTNGLRVGRFRADGSTFGQAVIEENTADNNRVSNAEITGAYSGGPITLVGVNSMVDPSATTGITAFAGGGKASATRLRSKYNVVATVATAADSVLLPAARLGDRVVVKNSGANAMQVFGQGTDTINGVATGTGISQAAATTVTYFATASGQWQT